MTSICSAQAPIRLYEPRFDFAALHPNLRSAILPLGNAFLSCFRARNGNAGIVSERETWESTLKAVSATKGSRCAERDSRMREKSERVPCLPPGPIEVWLVVVGVGMLLFCRGCPRVGLGYSKMWNYAVGLDKFFENLNDLKTNGLAKDQKPEEYKKPSHGENLGHLDVPSNVSPSTYPMSNLLKQAKNVVESGIADQMHVTELILHDAKGARPRSHNPWVLAIELRSKLLIYKLGGGCKIGCNSRTRLANTETVNEFKLDQWMTTTCTGKECLAERSPRLASGEAHSSAAPRRAPRRVPFCAFDNTALTLKKLPDNRRMLGYLSSETNQIAVLSIFCAEHLLRCISG
ncbi:hypothetical protein Acr_29g0008990 [Actinidia rufa]|uniref:Uncharacterized protein n=1 Tax=Actinidia rufa TaxID=165716 RepID=A0A7J0HF42_9ERIC|nr:hypothetical protein Acr_29g0008990 [Actinidia rufa]